MRPSSGTSDALDQDMLPTQTDDSTLDSIFMLPAGVTTTEIADACRGAALLFMNESPKWTKPDFSNWLAGPYAEITEKLRTNAESWHPVPLLREIDARMLNRLLKSSFGEVREALMLVTSGEGMARFANQMTSSGFVARCQDADGHEGFIPTNQPRRIADIVLSLFAADCLTRPGDYLTELTFCPQCGTLAFDAGARMRGQCGGHVSMFAPRNSNSFPYLPEGA